MNRQALAAAVFLTLLAGCTGAPTQEPAPPAEPAPGGAVEPTFAEEFIPVSLPDGELGARAVGLPPMLHAGIWLPGPPDSTHPTLFLPGGTYGEVAPLATVPTARLGEGTVEWFLQRGVAVVQASALGTGFSTHCVDGLGDIDAATMRQAVDWIVAQPWSDGRVASAGLGYDAALAVLAATAGHAGLTMAAAVNPPASLDDWLAPQGFQTHQRTGAEARLAARAVDSFADPERPGTSLFVDGKDAQAACASTADLASGTPTRSTERDLAARLTPSTRPVLLLAGAADASVPVHSSLRLHERLADAGVPHHVVVGPWGHAFGEGRAPEFFDPVVLTEAPGISSRALDALRVSLLESLDGRGPETGTSWYGADAPLQDAASDAGAPLQDCSPSRHGVQCVVDLQTAGPAVGGAVLTLRFTQPVEAGPMWVELRSPDGAAAIGFSSSSTPGHTRTVAFPMVALDSGRFGVEVHASDFPGGPVQASPWASFLDEARSTLLVTAPSTRPSVPDALTPVAAEPPADAPGYE